MFKDILLWYILPLVFNLVILIPILYKLDMISLGDTRSLTRIAFVPGFNLCLTIVWISIIIVTLLLLPFSILTDKIINIYDRLL